MCVCMDVSPLCVPYVCVFCLICFLVFGVSVSAYVVCLGGGGVSMLSDFVIALNCGLVSIAIGGGGIGVCSPLHALS